MAQGLAPHGAADVVDDGGGGLHGVGVSVVNALSSHTRVEVARDKQLYAQEFSRGVTQGKIQNLGPTPNRRGTTVSFVPDPEIFGSLVFKPSRIMRMVRSKAYLYSGVEIRWKTAVDDGETPQEAVFHFPGGLADYLSDTLEKTTTYADRPFAGKVGFPEKFNVPGSVEWAINWTPARDGFLQSYCNTVPTPEGGTHEAGFWAAILKGIRAYGDLVKNRKAELISRDDMLAGGCAIGARPVDLVVQFRDGRLQRLSDLHASYDPLHFVLFHPHGEPGWCVGLKQAAQEGRGGRLHLL